MPINRKDLPTGWRQPPETTAEPVPLLRPYAPVDDEPQAGLLPQPRRLPLEREPGAPGQAFGGGRQPGAARQAPPGQREPSGPEHPSGGRQRPAEPGHPSGQRQTRSWHIFGGRQRAAEAQLPSGRPQPADSAHPAGGSPEPTGPGDVFSGWGQPAPAGQEPGGPRQPTAPEQAFGGEWQDAGHRQHGQEGQAGTLPSAPVPPAALTTPPPVPASAPVAVPPPAVQRRRPMRAVIGDDLRVPMLCCEFGKCVERFTSEGALGELDLRDRAQAAGWRYDMLGRLACPACAQRHPAFWPARPDSAR